MRALVLAGLLLAPLLATPLASADFGTVREATAFSKSGKILGFGVDRSTYFPKGPGQAPSTYDSSYRDHLYLLTVYGDQLEVETNRKGAWEVIDVHVDPALGLKPSQLSAAQNNLFTINGTHYFMLPGPSEDRDGTPCARSQGGCVWVVNVEEATLKRVRGTSRALQNANLYLPNGSAFIPARAHAQSLIGNEPLRIEQTAYGFDGGRVWEENKRRTACVTPLVACGQLSETSYYRYLSNGNGTSYDTSRDLVTWDSKIFNRTVIGKNGVNWARTKLVNGQPTASFENKESAYPGKCHVVTRDRVNFNFTWTLQPCASNAILTHGGSLYSKHPENQWMQQPGGFQWPCAYTDNAIPVGNHSLAMTVTPGGLQRDYLVIVDPLKRAEILGPRATNTTYKHNFTIANVTGLDENSVQWRWGEKGATRGPVAQIRFTEPGDYTVNVTFDLRGCNRSVNNKLGLNVTIEQGEMTREDFFAERQRRLQEELLAAQENATAEQDANAPAPSPVGAIVSVVAAAAIASAGRRRRDGRA